VASGVTYLSLIHRASINDRSSKNRTGETSRVTGSMRGGMSWVGPRTQPRVSFPWKRNRT